MKLLVLFSGPVAVGKSSVAAELIKSNSFTRISTGSFLKEVAVKRGVSIDRTGLQEVGDALDVETDYRWVVDDVAIVSIEDNSSIDYWLLDSVRKERQVDHFRKKYDSECFHVHLNAAENLLRNRYNERLARGDEYVGNTPYDVAIRHPNEVSSRALINIADLVIEVAGLAPGAIAAELLTQAAKRRN